MTDSSRTREHLEPRPSERIMSPCPSCGRTTLIVGGGGYLVCGWLGGRDNHDRCSNPGLADHLLNAEAEHNRRVRAAYALIAADERRKAVPDA